jgi:hypothetical protein
VIPETIPTENFRIITGDTHGNTILESNFPSLNIDGARFLKNSFEEIDTETIRDIKSIVITENVSEGIEFRDKTRRCDLNVTHSKMLTENRNETTFSDARNSRPHDDVLDVAPPAIKQHLRNSTDVLNPLITQFSTGIRGDRTEIGNPERIENIERIRRHLIVGDLVFHPERLERRRPFILEVLLDKGVRRTNELIKGIHSKKSLKEIIILIAGPGSKAEGLKTFLFLVLKFLITMFILIGRVNHARDILAVTTKGRADVFPGRVRTLLIEIGHDSIETLMGFDINKRFPMVREVTVEFNLRDTRREIDPHVEMIISTASCLNNVFTVKKLDRSFPCSNPGGINETWEKILGEEGKDMMSGILIRASDGEEKILFRMPITTW